VVSFNQLVKFLDLGIAAEISQQKAFYGSTPTKTVPDNMDAATLHLGKQFHSSCAQQCLLKSKRNCFNVTWCTPSKTPNPRLYNTRGVQLQLWKSIATTLPKIWNLHRAQFLSLIFR